MMVRGIRPNTTSFTVLLGLLAALPALSIDISIPTLLAVQQQLVSTSRLVGLTITLFMVGFALGQFGGGPLSDRYGRRPILLGGLLAYTLAAVGCAGARSAEELISWRMVQGVGAGSCAVLAFAIIRDLFEGDAARSKRSYVTVVFGLTPMLAPSLGAWMLGLVGWRPVYLILAAAGIVLVVAVAVGVAESRPAATTGYAPQRMQAAYHTVLSNYRFAGLAAVNALSFGAMFAYIAGSSVVLMGDLHLSASTYAAFFACTAASLTAGAWTSGRRARAGVSPQRLLWISLSTAALTAVLLTLFLAAHIETLALLIPLLLVNLFCRGLTAPNAQHMALEPMREQAGTAAAAVGVMQILTGALASALVALLLPRFGPLGMTSVMAALAVGSLALWAWMAIAHRSAPVGRPAACHSD